MRNKFVYICSPVRGSEQQFKKFMQVRGPKGTPTEEEEKAIRRFIRDENSQRVKRICKAIVCTYPDIIPIAPHIYAPQFLSDEIPEERAAGIEMGLALLSKCSELWLFDSDGIGEGMAAELRYAEKNEIKIEYKDEETILKKWSDVL